MTNSLTDVDRELLGEASYNNGSETTTNEVKGGSDHGVLKDPYDIRFTPLNATAGTLVKINRNGDKVDADQLTKRNKDATTETTQALPKTPKKRGTAAAANEESSQPAKKRSPVKKAGHAVNGDATEPASPAPKTPPRKLTSPRKKDVAGANVKVEGGETDGETEGLEPVTPKKGKRTPAKAKGKRTPAKAKAAPESNKTSGGSSESTDKSLSPKKGNAEIDGNTVHNTPRKRQAPKKELAAPRGIPTSWDDADHADRMLVTMKEKGEGWSEIRTAWKAVTGQETASSTLPNRYNRIKVNMMRMKEEDEQHLLLAKQEHEATIQTSFWANIATIMERRGAAKYPVAFIQKRFKELEAAGKLAIVADDATTTTANNDNDVDEPTMMTTMKEEEEAQEEEDGKEGGSGDSETIA